VRAALAGVTAAAAWIAAEPVARRMFGTPFTDVRALGRPVSRRHWRVAGTAIHVANGAAAGIAFDRLGLRGWKAGVVAFQAEHLATWPLMVAVDRWHPDRRSGAWPPLLRNGRVFAQEAVVHAVFGVALGLLLPRRAENS
jgi:hypothetical protein